MSATAETLYRVALFDPIDNSEVQELGYFRERFARDFLAAYRRQTESDPDATLVAACDGPRSLPTDQ